MSRRLGDPTGERATRSADKSRRRAGSKLGTGTPGQCSCAGCRCAKSTGLRGGGGCTK